MSVLRRLFVRLLLPGVIGLLALGAEPALQLQIESLAPDGAVEIEEGTGLATSPAGVKITYGDTVLTARKVRVEWATGAVAAEGDVRIQRGKELWVGEKITYNFKDRQLAAEQFRTGQAPFLVGGQGLKTSFGGGSHSATNAIVTTDDVANPTYRVRAREVKLVPNEYIEAKGATLLLGKVPIMYLPSYRRPLDRPPNYFTFAPGYRSTWGAFLLSKYHWTIQTNLSLDLHLDYRTERGVGVGPDFLYDLGALGSGSLKTYYAYDERPGTNFNGTPIPYNRYFVNFSHSAFVNTNLAVKTVLETQSDMYVVRDFFEAEYRKNMQPMSYLEVSQHWPNFSLDFVTVPQFNDFFRTIERLPEVNLNAARQQLGISPFYYEAENSLGYLRFRIGDYPGTNYAAVRGDSYHQILLPQTFFGWLNFTPRVGGRYTYYGALDDFDSTSGDTDLNRWVFNTGAEVSTKLSRLWPGSHSKVFDVSGLRHIMTPSVNYVYVPRPNYVPSEIPQFDYELPSFQPLPITFPDYNDIDSIDSDNVLRFGLGNKLQTKRAGAVDNLVNWATFFDWRLNPRPDQPTLGDLYWDLELKPRKWLIVGSEVRYDLNDFNWRMANNTITIQPNDIVSWKGGQRYLVDFPSLDGSVGQNLWFSRLYFKLNENWAARMAHYFDARNGLMQEQDYTIYRDMRSWTLALVFRVQHSLGSPTDYTAAITFSFKTFPRYKLGTDRDYSSMLFGG